MDWKNRRVLLTGGGGFIGSHLVEELVKTGARVRCFVHYNSRGDDGMIEELDNEIVESLEIIRGDLLDPVGVLNATKGMDTVFHLGALISIPYSYVHPYHVAQVNILGTMNVLSAAKDVGVRRIVHTSTSEVYGTARQVPISEEHPLQGQSPYSASKIGADKMAESFYCAYNLPVCTIRPFNTYGPRQSCRAVIPAIITQTLKNESVKLGSLHPTRDFTYVGDTVRGFIKMAEADNVVGEVFNIGSGSEISIGELANNIMSIIGVQKQIICEEKRTRPTNSEVERLVCDNSKAKKILDWHPKILLNEGLKKTISWMGENAFLYDTKRYVY